MFGGELVNESEGEGFLKSKTFQKWTFFLDPPSLFSVPSVSKEHHRTIVCSRCYLTYFLYTAHKMVYGQHNTNMAVTLGGHSPHCSFSYHLGLCWGDKKKKTYAYKLWEIIWMPDTLIYIRRVHLLQTSRGM